MAVFVFLLVILAVALVIHTEGERLGWSYWSQLLLAGLAGMLIALLVAATW
jgi:hypothetical protein